MYTIVLAAFLTTGNEIPDFGRRGGCHGCQGGGFGRRGGRGGCYGCYGGGWGGCYGGGCFGGGGGCFGCGGGMMAMQAGGCSGSQGGGCSGSQGGGGAGAQGGRGGSGSQAGGSGSGSQGGGGGSAEAAQTLRDLKRSIEALKKEQVQIRIDALKLTADELKLQETDRKIDELRRDVNEMRRRLPPPPVGGPPSKNRRELPPPQPGKVLLEMPTDAVVLVNDRRIEAASSYLTQTLDSDKEYVLNIEAAVLRDGKSINRVKRLSIHSGEVVRLSYKDMESADGRWAKEKEAVSTPAHITVRLPADARLTVHGVACPLTSDTRTFDTPALASGQAYYYLLKAEVMRDGRAIAQTRRVDFRSGERVTVSFDNLGASLAAAR